MPTTETLSITAPDGGTFSAHVVRPDSGAGPGVLVLQEIFGINVYVREVCERLAKLGYVAVAPDLFWRIQPHIDISTFDPDSVQSAMALGGKFDAALGVGDIGAALEVARGLSSNGKVGELGFCFGGTFAYLSAVHHRPDAVVSYYGSGVAANLDKIDQVTCPLLFQFGAQDPYIPDSDVAAIQAAIAGRQNLALHVYPEGGHAFDNSFSPFFSRPPAAQAAWARAVPFLATHLQG
jgi:carboxymethylenebutenolidase